MMRFARGAFLALILTSFSASAVELLPGRTEIVVSDGAPSPVRFAAKELKTFLGIE